MRTAAASIGRQAEVVDPSLERVPARSGTYALFLELPVAQQLEIGRLGSLPFSAAVYLYSGSAFGPGGLRARLQHHLHPSPRPHWHVDYLRPAASLTGFWSTSDPRRLECLWAAAAGSLPGARQVAGFGSSDCRCVSHLVALPRVPRRRAFRRQLRSLAPPCGPILLVRAYRRTSV